LVCRLSWGWCVALPSTCRVCVHSQRRCRRLRPTDVPVPVSLVPSSSSCTTSTACSTHPLAAASQSSPARWRLSRGLGTGRRPPPKRLSGSPRPASCSVGSVPGVSGRGLVASHCRTGFAAFQVADVPPLDERHVPVTSPPDESDGPTSQDESCSVDSSEWVAPLVRGCRRAGRPRVPPLRTGTTFRRIVCPAARADPRSFPQRGSHPSKKSPRLQPHPVTRTVALLPLCLHPSPAHVAQAVGGDPRLQGLAPLSGP